MYDGPADRGAGAQGGGPGRQAGDQSHRDHGLLYPSGTNLMEIMVTCIRQVPTL